jgi:hypothetical protein
VINASDGGTLLLDFHTKYKLTIVIPIAKRAKEAKASSSMWQMSIFRNCNKLPKIKKERNKNESISEA